MDYPYANFGDFSFSRFGFIVRTDTHTHTQNHRITDATKRIPNATVVGVSNNT